MPFSCEKISTSGKIRVVRNVSWPLATMVIVVVLVIGGVALFDRDINAVSNTILMLLVALGLAELREIKSNTNGSQTTLMEQNRKLLDEIGQYRREAARITDRALDSAPLQPPAPVPVVVVPEPDQTVILPPQHQPVQFPPTRP